jgi:CHAT domain-containing protein
VLSLYRAAFADQPADLLAGADAGEAALKQRLDGGRVRVVHLATHGFFESPDRFDALRADWIREEPPFRPAPADRTVEDHTVSALAPLVRSGVVLTGGGAIKPEPISFAGNIARSGGRPVSEDGIFTAEEVRPLDLRGTELVVLSACETGLGDIEAGQGVLGLQRAFHAAGARAVVASLWKVDDAATATLMERFYTNLWTKRLPKLEALRQAQLDVLRDPSLAEARRARPSPRGLGAKAEPLLGGGKADPAKPLVTRADPALWAAFLLSGDGRQ